MAHGPRGDAIETEQDLDLYCYRVAGTVGLVVTAMLGERMPRQRQAVALAVAMQRTNILRDGDEDGRPGAPYLARETLRLRLGLVERRLTRAAQPAVGRGRVDTPRRWVGLAATSRRETPWQWTR